MGKVARPTSASTQVNDIQLPLITMLCDTMDEGASELVTDFTAISDSRGNEV